MTDAQIESLAIRAAKGNNGGEWATHYTDEQKAYWRTLIQGIVAEVVAECVRAAEDSVDAYDNEVIIDHAEFDRPFDAAMNAIRRVANRS